MSVSASGPGTPSQDKRIGATEQAGDHYGHSGRRPIVNVGFVVSATNSLH
jgi:hypothetical protein